MKTIRVAITGVDGTGKTSVIRKLNQLYAGSPHQVFAIRAPQYHEDARLPARALSGIIDQLSVQADRTQNPELKAMALFLSMTLYGDIENYVVNAYAPQILFMERQCLVDTLAYAQFYLPLLNQRGEKFERPHPEISYTDSAEIAAWAQVLKNRDSSFCFESRSFYLDPQKVFSGSSSEVLLRLMRLFHASIPDRIVILTASPESIRSRLLAKKGETPVTELHEKSEVLSCLVFAMRQVALLLKAMSPGLVVQEIATESKSVDEVADEILEPYFGVGGSSSVQSCLA